MARQIGKKRIEIERGEKENGEREEGEYRERGEITTRIKIILFYLKHKNIIL